MRRRSPLNRLLAIAATFGCLCAAWPQHVSYCNVTAIKATRLGNGVELTIEADGFMSLEARPDYYFDIATIQAGQLDKAAKQVTELPFSITNARSKVGSITDIGTYPVSHVELTVPPEAREGVGLNVKVVLFAPTTVLTLPDFDISFSENDKPTTRFRLSQDRRSLIILITSDRRTVVPVVRRTAAPDAPRSLSVEEHGGRLDIVSQNADLRELTRLISQKSRSALIADDVLVRTVSLSLPDVTAREAAESLAAAYGLTITEVGGVLHLGDGDAGSTSATTETAFDTVRLRYTEAVAMRDALPDFLLRHVHVNTLDNSLSLFGPKPLVEKLRADVEKLDTPIPQITVEARAIEFASSDDLNTLLAASGQWGHTNLGLDTETGDVNYFYAGPLPGSFSAALRAEIARGSAVIRAHPKTTVLNGGTAHLFVGTEKLMDVTYLDWLTGLYTGKILQVEVGVTLDVTPWTGGGGFITALVAPQVSNISETTKNGEPTVLLRKAQTTVRISDGDTVVIGGLQLQQQGAATRGIPGPLKGNQKSNSRSELVWFVTARIGRSEARQ